LAGLFLFVAAQQDCFLVEESVEMRPMLLWRGHLMTLRLLARHQPGALAADEMYYCIITILTMYEPLWLEIDNS
jgi:hypothetical protein